MTRIQAACSCASLALACALGSGIAARAQPMADNAAGSINLGARGGIAFGAPARPAPAQSEPAQDRPESPVEFNFRAGLATDYVYRGVTLSAHQPAAGAAFEVAHGIFYAAGSVATVKLPSQPVAEIATTGGIRPKWGSVQFDFSATHFAYPNETPPAGVTAGIDYWEAIARADTRINELLTIAGGFAYSPNVSNTGAWSSYAAVGVGLDLPGSVMPQDLGASVTAGVGYSWFGSQSPALGGFPLPAYLNWNAGMTVTYQKLNLDLRYYDTNLSRENCFVFTGDPSATLGGRPNAITNPAGLMSNWCSATFVAKYWFAFN